MTSIFDKAKAKRLKQTSSVSQQATEASEKLANQYQCVTQHCLEQPSSQQTREKLEQWHKAHQKHANHHIMSPPHEN
ncbi:hypothetical protein L1D13_13875 [Vibrio tubiashii]|uniref:hypothetical protein n=1 Tax=Vibrio tubiashii TaxID=29498 RepID=UPI001EFC7F5F|nr:hypothetical protein [Vibrio tubiashii]MCG9582094.1 hypothetical protein [Vibrio tubiashii]MCG9615685.1 hypothetical protein [Vibrio tubiashii]MCG9688011.1 hypothetical protein [Vibrio tubiashii]